MACTDCFEHCCGADVKRRRRKPRTEITDAARRQIDNNIDVVRESRFAVRDGCRGAGDKIREPKPVEHVAGMAEKVSCFHWPISSPPPAEAPAPTTLGARREADSAACRARTATSPMRSAKI